MVVFDRVDYFKIILSVRKKLIEAPVLQAGIQRNKHKPPPYPVVEGMLRASQATVLAAVGLGGQAGGRQCGGAAWKVLAEGGWHALGGGVLEGQCGIGHAAEMHLLSRSPHVWGGGREEVKRCSH